MASSSCSSARPTGFWQLQPRRSRNRRSALVEWYGILKRALMTLATRSRVHIGVGKPAASGPATKTSINSRSCSGSSRGLRPALPAALRACLPPSSRWRFQRNTDCRITPVRRATSAWENPFPAKRTPRSAAFPCLRSHVVLPCRNHNKTINSCHSITQSSIGTGRLLFESRLNQLPTATVRSFGSQVWRKLFWQ